MPEGAHRNSKRANVFAGSDSRAASLSRIVEVSDAEWRDSPTAAVGGTGSGAESVEELPRAAERAAMSE